MKLFIVLATTLIATTTAAPARCGRSPGWHGCKNRSNGSNAPRQQTRTQLNPIASIAAATPSLSTLLTAVVEAGLADTLSGPGTFTVFAPNNAAFGKLPEGTIPTLLKPENKEQLTKILLRHVLPLNIVASKLPRGLTVVKTVGGEELEITKTGRGVSIRTSDGISNVIAADIFASNGVVHVLDTVITANTNSDDVQQRQENTGLKSIASTAAATPSLSTLLAAVKAAGLAETLSGAGTFTVFAPNNAAFGKLPEGTIPSLLKPENKEQLTKILLRHVLPVQIKASEIPQGTTKVKTVGGEEIEITNTGRGVSIRTSDGSANVVAADVLASNGVVHVLDTVITANPNSGDVQQRQETSGLKSIASTAAATPSLSTLLAAVKAAGLAETLSGAGTFTVFAPNNAAFEKLPPGTVSSLLRPENKDELSAVLLRHVLPVQINAGQIPLGATEVKTVDGQKIEITNTGERVYIRSSFGSANVIATDVLASNGVVHVVDGVF